MQEQLLTTRDVLYAFGRKPYDDEKKPKLIQGWRLRQPSPSKKRQPTPDRSATINMTQQIKLACFYQIVHFDVFYYCVLL